MERNSLGGQLLFSWKNWSIKRKSLYLEWEQWCRANLPCPQESFSADDRSALIEVQGNWRQSGFWIMHVAPVQHKLRGGLVLEQLSCVRSQPALSLFLSPKSANFILSTQLPNTLFLCNLDLPSLLRIAFLCQKYQPIFFPRTGSPAWSTTTET